VGSVVCGEHPGTTDRHAADSRSSQPPEVESEVPCCRSAVEHMLRRGLRATGTSAECKATGSGLQCVSAFQACTFNGLASPGHLDLFRWWRSPDHCGPWGKRVSGTSQAVCAIPAGWSGNSIFYKVTLVLINVYKAHGSQATGLAMPMTERPMTAGSGNHCGRETRPFDKAETLGFVSLSA